MFQKAIQNHPQHFSGAHILLEQDFERPRLATFVCDLESGYLPFSSHVRF